MYIYFYFLQQELANCDPWTKSRLPPILLIKFYWNTDLPIYFCIVYGCFHVITSSLRSYDKDSMSCKAGII